MLVKLESSNTVFHKLALSSPFQKTGVPASPNICPVAAVFMSLHFPTLLHSRCSIRVEAKAVTVTSQEEYCFDVLFKVQGTSQTTCKLNLEAEWGIGLQTATLFTPQTSPVSFLPVWNKTAQQLTHKQKLKIQF